MRSMTTRMVWLTAFSIAMGFLETAVVVYLRKIYYPNGFQFPLNPIETNIAATEFFREAATVIMLLGIGIIAGKNTSQKFVFFLYCFAVWDIFYYVFLKVLLGWPESLFTWDILFLIPVPWVGPVIAPCLVSLTMILLTLSVIYFQEKGYHAHLSLREWLFLVAGSLVVIVSFMLDYFKFMSQAQPAIHAWSLSSKQAMFNEISHYVPSGYNWWLFSAGEMTILAGILFFVNRVLKQDKPEPLGFSEIPGKP